MTTKEIAALLTKEEQAMILVSHTVTANVITKLLERLAQERQTVQVLKAKLKAGGK